MSGEQLRAEVIATALKMNALRINRGKSGNVSARRQRIFDHAHRRALR